MSTNWEEHFDNRYSEWKASQTVTQLDDLGICASKWQNQGRERSQGPSALIAAGCFCGIGLACFVVFVNWAVKVVTR